MIEVSWETVGFGKTRLINFRTRQVYGIVQRMTLGLNRPRYEAVLGSRIHPTAPGRMFNTLQSAQAWVQGAKPS